jgi:uncharacterized protein YndB with AHSA1/START domain
MNVFKSSARHAAANLVEMEINREAPVVVSATADVTAPRDVVWNVVADIDSWPRWNPDVSEVSLSGELAPGSEFRWKAGPGTIRSTLREVEPPRRIAWSGKSLGASAVHVWTLEPTSGGTTVRTEESADGLVVRLLRSRMQKTFQERSTRPSSI